MPSDDLDVFAVQDEIIHALTTALTPAIADAELRRAIRKPPESPDAWAAYQRGLWHLSKANSEDDTIAQNFFRQAIFDPRDPFMAVRLLHIACGLYFAREYEGVIEAAKRLIRSYPDFPMIHRWPAAALGQLGRAAEAREWLEKAISYAPAAFKMYVHNRVPWFRPEDHAHLVEGPPSPRMKRFSLSTAIVAAPCDDRRVIAHDRASDRCHQLNLPRGLGGGTEHRPRERRMALFVEPRKEIVRNRREGEPGLLGTDHVADQGGRPVLFCH
jgi:tetratricopeptide (TPR) repeat protein